MRIPKNTVWALCTAIPIQALRYRFVGYARGNKSRSVAGHRPRHVQVVAGEEEAVRDPVAASERAVHARKEVPAEQELLAEHGVEEEHREDEAVPAQGAVQERFAGVRLDERGEVPVPAPRTIGTSSWTR